LRRSFHLGYAWAVGIWTLLALLRTGVESGKRLVVLGVLALIGMAETIALQFPWTLMRWTDFTVIPQVVNLSVHLAEGVVLLFFMRTDRISEYQPIVVAKEDVGPLMDEVASEGEEEEEEEEEDETEPL
jgi:hypothetical protein